MIPLLNAIYAKFVSDGTLTAAFPGGLHRDRAPEGTVMPYVVSTVSSAPAELTYGTQVRNHVQVRFDAYGVGHDATGALMDSFIASFDNALLTLSVGSDLSIVRQGDVTPKLHRHDAQGNDVWEWSVTYLYEVGG
jgi:hypothetical protein